MSCIVGVLDDDGNIFVGSDSAGLSGLDIRLRKDPKVFIRTFENTKDIRENFIIGCAGSFRMCQILQNQFVVIPDDVFQLDPYEFMISYFIQEIRDTFKKEGFSSIKDNVESQDGVILIGFRKSLFTIYSDFQVEEVRERYTAIGCGKNYALGALYGIRNLGIGYICAQEQVSFALEAAGYFSAGVRAPFNILSIS